MTKVKPLPVQSIVAGPVTAPGLYDMPAEIYHADPCEKPSLNHTVAKIIHDKSPLHAFNAHPRLGNKAAKPSRIMDLGSAVHSLSIGKGEPVMRLKFKDYRTKAAQEARDALRAGGTIPLLDHEYEQAHEMAKHMRAAIEDVAGGKIETLLRETAIIANEGHTWSRSMIDVCTPDLRLLIDAKTTATAEPDAYGRMVIGHYASAVAFYFQNCDLIDPKGIGKRRFVFIAQERECPEAITYHELDPTALELADAQMKRARLRWALCSHTNSWPSYDRGPHIAVPRQWDVDAELERAFQEQTKGGAV